MREKNRSRAPLRELGCLAANGPKFEPPFSFESNVINDVVLTVVWSGNEVFNNRGEVREVPAGDYKSHIDSLLNSF